MTEIHLNADIREVCRRLDERKKKMSPIYSYACVECGHTQDVIRNVRDLDKELFCEECENQMKHVPEVPSRFVRGSGSWSSPA